MIAEAGIHAHTNASSRNDRAFTHSQGVLGTSFVPTVYRRLCAYPEPFHAAVDQIERIVSLAKANDFVRTAQQAARTGLTHQSEPVVRVHKGVAEVVRGYRSLNPVNLLVSMAIIGTSSQPLLPVMEPLLDCGSDQIWEDFVHSHGSVITPGLSRALTLWPDDPGCRHHRSPSPEGSKELAWFPTGIATMVAEGEWLNTLIAQPDEGNSHEQA